MPQASTPPAPTRPAERITAIDLLRGFALLGILVMNIQEFSMPIAAYANPTAYGDLTGANRWVWILSHVFTDLKFITIFSLLFGAGIALMTSNLEALGFSSVAIHYRRTFWLLVFGLSHAYLLWTGDILVFYAAGGFWVYWLRNLRPGWQIALGLLLVAAVSGLMLAENAHYSSPSTAPQAIEALQNDWKPVQSAMQKEVAAYRGNWLAQMEARVPLSLDWHIYGFLYGTAWRASGLMLIGMALYRWGILSGRSKRGLYVAMAVLGLGIGLPIVISGVVHNFARNWAAVHAQFGLGAQANYWGSLFVSTGYIGLLMLFARSNAFRWLQDALAAVGRTALTNYLLQTILATAIFYGHGLSLFGSIERVGQIGIVAAIWAVQLAASPLWLRRYRFGPMEWLWRSLTYWRLQPMRNPS